MKKETKNKESERNLPNVRWLTEEQLFQLQLTPEENFMPQEIKDYLKLAMKEIERRRAVKEEYKLKKRLKREFNKKFNKTPKVINSKQKMLPI